LEVSAFVFVRAEKRKREGQQKKKSRAKPEALLEISICTRERKHNNKTRDIKRIKRQSELENQKQSKE